MLRSLKLKLVGGNLIEVPQPAAPPAAGSLFARFVAETPAQPAIAPPTRLINLGDTPRKT